jgi:hypothetical protein
MEDETGATWTTQLEIRNEYEISVKTLEWRHKLDRRIR